MNPVSRMFSAPGTQAVLSIAVTIPAAAGILWWLTTSTRPGDAEDSIARVTQEATEDHTARVTPEVAVRPAATSSAEAAGQNYATVFIVDSEEAADRLRVSLQEGHAPSAWLTGNPALGEILVADGRAHADQLASTLAECERLLAGLSVPQVQFIQVASQ